MSAKSEIKAKERHNKVAKWLNGLEPRQIRALASQHKISGWETESLGTLRDSLMVLRKVAVQAGVITDGKEVQTKKRREKDTKRSKRLAS